MARSQRLLAEVDGDVVERGYVLIHLMYRHTFAGEFAAACAIAEEITGYGHRHRDPDLVAMGLSSQGRCCCTAVACRTAWYCSMSR